jgi:hypothetical protein
LFSFQFNVSRTTGRYRLRSRVCAINPQAFGIETAARFSNISGYHLGQSGMQVVSWHGAYQICQRDRLMFADPLTR